METQRHDQSRSGVIKNTVIALQGFVILCFLAYMVWNNNRSEQTQTQQQASVSKATDEKGQLQKNFDDALVRLDSMTERNDELKRQIRSLLSKEHLSESESSRAVHLDSVEVSRAIEIGKVTLDKDVNAIKIPVFFGTDRMPTGSRDPYTYYGGQKNTRTPYQVGLVEVSIPLHRSVGELNLPAYWNFWADKRDTSKYFVIRSLEVLNYYNFYRQLQNAVQTSGEKDLFVFVHGFNSSFADAAERTAQLAYDLGFRGAPIMFSWPSAGSIGITGYVADEANIIWTVHNLKAFLSDIISKTGAKKINLIAHSMGNRALCDALTQLTLEHGVVFNQIILAAPDVDQELFRTQIAPNIRRQSRAYYLVYFVQG